MPATGIINPHNRFWMAIANAKVSRSHPIAPVIGVRNRPNVDRAPNPTMQIKQPATITIAGVLHLEVTEARSIPFMGSSKVKNVKGELLLDRNRPFVAPRLLLRNRTTWSDRRHHRSVKTGTVNPEFRPDP
jgi:hypothetical protein